MRLFELEGGVPDLQKLLTPKLVDDIIASGKWVDHGSDLEDWLETSCYASDLASAGELDVDPSIEELPYDEHRKHPDFRKCVADWVGRAVKEMQDVLQNGQVYDNVPPFGPDMVLYRCMAVSEEWLAAPEPQMGIFWSAVKGQALRFRQDAAGKRNVMMMVRVSGIGEIDWYQTLRSRIDYNSGFDEQEFQLVKGTSLQQVAIKVLGTDKTLVKNGRA